MQIQDMEGSVALPSLEGGHEGVETNIFGIIKHDHQQKFLLRTVYLIVFAQEDEPLQKYHFVTDGARRPLMVTLPDGKCYYHLVQGFSVRIKTSKEDC